MHQRQHSCQIDDQNKHDQTDDPALHSIADQDKNQQCGHKQPHENSLPNRADGLAALILPVVDVRFLGHFLVSHYLATKPTFL